MKKITSIFLAFIMLFASAVPAFADDAAESREVRLVAHRGMSELAPENTIPAFELAAEYGYYGVEFDLQLTSDGVWVVCHEDDTGRMSTVDGRISEKTYDELMESSIDSGEGIENYENLKFPTLEQVLQICEKNSLAPYIEVKAGGHDDLDRIIASLKEHGLYDSAVLISTGKDYCTYFKETYPDATVWFVSYFTLISDITYAEEAGLDGMTFNTTFFNPFLLWKIKGTGMTISFWTPDSKLDCFLFSLYGSSDFTTNNLIYDESGNPVPLKTGTDALSASFSRLVSMVEQAIALIASYI